MNRKMYNKALSYAFMLMPYHENYYDLVHDAWVSYHKSSGKDLFDQDERVVIKTVKNCWYNITRREHLHTEEHLRKIFIKGTDELRTSNVPIDKRVEGEDSIEWLYDQAKKYYGTLAVKNPSQARFYNRALTDTEEVVNLQHQGYNQKEISEKIDTTTTTIKKYMDVLKEIITENPETPFNVITYNNYNPFNASRVRVCKTILSNTYRVHKEKYSDYEYNTDNGADYNEFYVLLTHKELGKEDGLLIRNTDKVKIEPQ
jgi:DNA-directed RNA polymerase specialized sigma24 family protein